MFTTVPSVKKCSIVCSLPKGSQKGLFLNLPPIVYSGASVKLVGNQDILNIIIETDIYHYMNGQIRDLFLRCYGSSIMKIV